ncbi:sel1 repeat family protein [Oxalobacter vibrioformis]|uniref:Sel1 repeat family protein n=2 Tax=Oxalobacter vibrioformis TaxID=933080 RepID=A0A9E9LZR3_9BURK|nr:sel1 repeat family protein [Oxalobacter vibrioformis]
MKAAENGDAEAQYNVAYLFPGDGTVKDSYVQALEWTRKAAMQGHPMAAFNLGGMYEAGQGVDKDWVEAGRWYVYAAGMGNANAIRRLDRIADTCRRFPERPECDEAKLRDAASRADAASLYRIGLAYKDGDGIERDYRKSLFWLRYAAGMGYVKAQYELGDTFENALGVGRSAAQARFWFEKAAARGDAESAIRLQKLKSDEKEE